MSLGWKRLRTASYRQKGPHSCARFTDCHREWKDCAVLEAAIRRESAWEKKIILRGIPYRDSCKRSGSTRGWKTENVRPLNRAVCLERFFPWRENSHRFQGVTGSEPALSLSTLLLNQPADSQLFHTFVAFSRALNGVIIASTKQGWVKHCNSIESQWLSVIIMKTATSMQ